jgi:prepilin-type processing-associated H-X9-DG protein
MSTLTFMLAWCVLQVTLLSLLTAMVYLVVGRRGPAVGSAVLLAGSAGVLLTTALAVSPWPRWYTVEWSTQPVVAVTKQAAEAKPADTAVALSNAGDIPANAVAPKLELADASLWTALGETLRTGFRPAALDAPRATPWPAIVLGLGAALCLGRLLVGLWAVHRYRRKSQPVADAQLHDELCVLQAEMSCQRTIEPRESALVSSPAVVGWRKPLLLLPLDWRTWSDGERRAVLAHELAHVCRGDYPAWLFSQLGLALHFYHPLVHWLVRRLRLEQELAADEWGARVAGSRTAYLRALAQLALRRDTQPVVWAARPFFPRRDTFLRRIEMLRHQQNQPWRATPWRTRLVAVSAVVGAALLVAGLRGPESNSALAQVGAGAPGAAAASPASAEKFSLKFVPAEALGLLAFRPADLLAEPGVGDFAKKFDWTAHVEQQLGIKLTDLEEVTLAFQANPEQVAPMWILRGRGVAAAVVAATGKKAQTETRQFGGADYTVATGFDPNAFFAVNADTLVVASEPQIRLAITTAQGGFDGLPGPPWAKEWEDWNTEPVGQVRFAVNIDGIKAATGFDPNRLAEQHRVPGDMASLLASVGPLLTNTQSVVGSGHVNGGMQISLVATTSSSEAAKSVAETTIALKVLLKNLTTQMRQALLRQPDAPAGVPQLMAMAEDVLAKTEVKADDKLVRITANTRYNGAMAAAIFMPAMAQARESASRVQSQNHLKQLGLAMHIYADQFKTFPPASVIGPDGKTPHSWRVAILPYIEQQALYNQYKFDEPWDSEANRKVLAQMPALFRNPSDAPNSTNTSYFVFTGQGPMFGGDKGPGFAEITDGMSNTIMIVEAKRDIPWTKPEDIAYDAKQPLPKLGGYYPGGFNAAFADGSVRFLHDGIDDQALRALITKAGGESIDPGALNPAPGRKPPLNAVDGPSPGEPKIK